MIWISQRKCNCYLCEGKPVDFEREAHNTVLKKEAVAALRLHQNGGVYVDGTFGRGGHSAEILRGLWHTGELLAIDQDPEACAWARQYFKQETRFSIEQASFGDLDEVVARRQLMGKVLGVLLDLGVSSPQLDNPERGFSFLRDGPLDMRMNPESGQSAAQWIAIASEDEITRVLKEYGEERHARRMARAIIIARKSTPLTRTRQLADIIAAANPSWEKSKHPATRAFQAIRIFVNSEIQELQRFLDSILDILAVGGRLVIISFHSLEDRIVKRFIRGHDRPVLPKGLPLRDNEISRCLRSIGRAVRASDDEIKSNPRARSAVMRVAEKIA
jgi:16S rRNA (cytosine1402-N4)-methyltransferase